MLLGSGRRRDRRRGNLVSVQRALSKCAAEAAINCRCALLLWCVPMRIRPKSLVAADVAVVCVCARPWSFPTCALRGDTCNTRSVRNGVSAAKREKASTDVGCRLRGTGRDDRRHDGGVAKPQRECWRPHSLAKSRPHTTTSPQRTKPKPAPNMQACYQCDRRCPTF